MKSRNRLRVAWSILCGTLTVLLAWLCLRSCLHIDGVSVDINRYTYLAISHDGIVELGRTHDPSIQSASPSWNFSSSPIKPTSHSSSSLFLRWFTLTPEAMVVPLWLPMMLTAVCALAPWLFHLHFSLRTLLVAITLAAIGLGLIAWLFSNFA